MIDTIEPEKVIAGLKKFHPNANIREVLPDEAIVRGLDEIVYELGYKEFEANNAQRHKYIYKPEISLPTLGIVLTDLVTHIDSFPSEDIDGYTLKKVPSDLTFLRLIDEESVDKTNNAQFIIEVYERVNAFLNKNRDKLLPILGEFDISPSDMFGLFSFSTSERKVVFML